MIPPAQQRLASLLSEVEEYVLPFREVRGMVDQPRCAKWNLTNWRKPKQLGELKQQKQLRLSQSVTKGGAETGTDRLLQGEIMRVVICGGGVIGACTAYFLSR
jgi:hypothetical protein